MTYLRYIPLFGIMLIAYNLIMLVSPVFSENPGIIKIPLLAGDGAFLLTVSETFAMIGIILLYFEILKATRTGRDTIIDHMLSTAVFIICIIEFLAVPSAGTAAFLILTLLSLMDLVAGFTITITGARRDMSLGTPS
jgi:hypothetical protein